MTSVTKRCPGSGKPMVRGAYRIRHITDKDRATQQRSLEIMRSNPHLHSAAEVERYIESFATWETEQGMLKHHLVCSVCGDWTLKPTRSGTTYHHTVRP